MKILTSKSIWKKIIIALLIILTFQIIATKPVHADVVQFGGKLMGPIMSLLVSLCDGINDILSSAIMGVGTTIFEVDMADGWWDNYGFIVVGIVAAGIAAVAAIFLPMGIAAAGTAISGWLASIVPSATAITFQAVAGVGTLIAAAGTGVLVGTWYSDTQMPDDLYLPMYSYSAEEIFKNHILLFNVDFFGDDTTIWAELSDENHTQIVVSGKTDEQIQEELSKHKVTVEKTEHKGHVEVERTAQLKFQQLYKLIIT